MNGVAKISNLFFCMHLFFIVSLSLELNSEKKNDAIL